MGRTLKQKLDRRIFFDNGVNDRVLKLKFSSVMDSFINALEMECSPARNKGELFKNMILYFVNYNITLIINTQGSGITRAEI